MGLMAFPANDVFWTETEYFIRTKIGSEAPFIGPREFYTVLSRVFPYDWVHAVEVLDDYKGVAVHKGLLHELPLPLLQHLRTEWKCVFANDVFLFYVPPSSPLPPADEAHQRFFFDRLKTLQVVAETEKTHIRDITALLVIASHSPAMLKRLLDSTSLLHAPTLVVTLPVTPARQEEYREVCEPRNVRLEQAADGSSITQALRMGVQLWLDDPDIAWICTLDDTMLVRPDFLSAMKKFRSHSIRSNLGGLWTEADGARAIHSIDGYQLIHPINENTVHRYGNRAYWSRRFSLDRQTSSVAWRDWKKFLFGPGQEPSLVIRDLVTHQTLS